MKLTRGGFVLLAVDEGDMYADLSKLLLEIFCSFGRRVPLIYVGAHFIKKVLVWPCFTHAPRFLSLSPSQFYLPGTVFGDEDLEARKRVVCTPSG